MRLNFSQKWIYISHKGNTKEREMKILASALQSKNRYVIIELQVWQRKLNIDDQWWSTQMKGFKLAWSFVLRFALLIQHYFDKFKQIRKSANKL